MSRTTFALAVSAALLAGCQESTTSADRSPSSSPNSQQVTEPTATITWNQVARDLVVKNRSNAFVGIRAFALLSVAQYNAVLATDTRKSDQLPPSRAGAVAGASAAVLTSLYPDDAALLEGKVDAQRSAPVPAGSQHESFSAGEQLGRTIAARVLGQAQDDRFFAPFTGTVPVCDGCWLPVPTPPAFATLGMAKPFFLTSGGQLRPAAPPAFGSPDYLAGLAEVRQIADARTAVQDSIAKFWALPVGTVGPLGYWNAVGSELIARYHLDERRASSVLALMNATAFDAIIASHDAKFTFWLIRPSQADPAINLAIGLPSFPSYPSNHATVSAAATTILGAFFPNERASLDSQADEAGLSRLFGGIHYRFDVDSGLALGRRIGQYVMQQDVTGFDSFVLR
ncbi:MAG TPA: vanadium-dependent haloperoxidase [Gemmatimonadaceae bacterium]|nr:vanadium-dependent haloperoxidase [Gemmatimonadaceae bacterium]